MKKPAAKKPAKKVVTKPAAKIISKAKPAKAKVEAKASSKVKGKPKAAAPAKVDAKLKKVAVPTKAAPVKAGAAQPKATAAPKPAVLGKKGVQKPEPKAGAVTEKGAHEKAALDKKGPVAKGGKPAKEEKETIPEANLKGKAGKGKAAKVEAPVDREILMEDLGLEPMPEEAPLTDAEGRPVCKSKDCDQLAMVSGYCRYHYLLLWKKIQLRKKILADGKLEKYIEDLTSRYPDKYIEMIRRDLRTEKDFMSAIQELEIDDSGAEAEFEEESENLMDEVRGMGGQSRPGREDDEF